MFLKIRNIISKNRRSKVVDFAALIVFIVKVCVGKRCYKCAPQKHLGKQTLQNIKTLHNLKTADLVLLSMFMRINGEYNNVHTPLVPA